MPSLVSPVTYLVGFTVTNMPGIEKYLADTKQQEFLEDIAAAREIGISDGEIICSMFAKLCYKSLVEGKNANITSTRPIAKNLIGCHETAHGSVFEHCSLNFLTTNCSRVFTHELVRHRAGMAFSQTSGRFCRLENLDLVWDPILDEVKDLFMEELASIERTVYLAECRLGLRKPSLGKPEAVPSDAVTYLKIAADKKADAKYWLGLAEASMWVPDMLFNMDKRKALTSAIRKIAPNGQANEMGWTANLRSLRHLVMVRTAPKAEYEIRLVFNQVYDLAKEKFPLLFYGAKEKIVDGQRAIYGMKTQPYEKSTDYLE